MIETLAAEEKATYIRLQRNRAVNSINCIQQSIDHLVQFQSKVNEILNNIDDDIYLKFVVNCEINFDEDDPFTGTNTLYISLNRNNLWIVQFNINIRQGEVYLETFCPTDSKLRLKDEHSIEYMFELLTQLNAD